MDSTALMFWGLLVAIILFVTKVLPNLLTRGKRSVGDQKPESLKGYEKEMYECGYTKRVVAWDFLTKIEQNANNLLGRRHHFTVGIWLNYKKQLMSLRVDRSNWDAIYFPFHKIQSVEVIEDGKIKTRFGGVILSGVILGGSTSKEFSIGLQVRIVIGDMSNGTKAYFLNLFDPIFGAKREKNDSEYMAIQECARTIADEINIIMQNSHSAKPQIEKEHSKRDIRQCPYCSEEILSTAKKCKHCGEWLEVK